MPRGFASQSAQQKMKTDPAFRRTVLSSLHRFGRRVRLFVLIEGLAIVVATLGAMAALQFALDYFLTLDRVPRGVLLAGVAAAGLHQLWHRLLRPLAARLDLDRLAAT